MRILYIADFGSEFYGGIDYKSDGMLANGLESLGHDVCRISYREIRNNFGELAMSEAIYRDDMDVVIIGYGDGINPKLIKVMKDKGAKIVYWYGDARPELEQWVIDLASVSDLFLTTTAGSTMREYKARSGCNKVAFFPNLVDLELYKPLKKELGSIIFTGNNYGEPIRAISAEALAHAYPNQFRGYGWNNPRVLGPLYTEVLGKADFGLCVSAFHDRDKMQSSRTLEHMSCGVCCLVKRVPRLEELLGKDGSTYLGFDNPNDVPRILEENRELSRAIGRNAREYVSRNFSHTKIAEYILDELRDNYELYKYGKWVEVL